MPVSDKCKDNDASGACTLCYKGYHLDQGSCVLNNVQLTPDLGCKNWDWDSLVCLACSKEWVLINKVCVPVSDQCLTFDSATGDCLTCYNGYNLQNGKCIIQDLNLVVPSDKGCKDWNWAQQICLTCSNMWFLDSQGKCVPVSDLCKSADPNGKCLSCFKGYDLKDGTCTLSSFNNAKPADSGCGKWDWDNQKCLECSKGWVFNA